MPVPPDRRELLAASAALGSAFMASSAGAVTQTSHAKDDPPRKRYAMKKSINLWAFPYPQRMTLKECLQLAKDAGFDGIELNYDLDNDLSPKSGTEGIRGHPQDGRGDRHRHQRPLLVPVLAVLAHQQRPRHPQPRPGTGRRR